MSSDDPFSNAAEGAVKGALDWSAERIASLVKKLKEKELAFIQDPKTIEIVKEQYRSGEAKFYQTYINDRDLLFLVKLGLTLRKVAEDKDRLNNLRDKIYEKYGINGLHVAEFVQTGMLNRYVGILIDELTSIEYLKKQIEEVLKNIEKHALFVQVTSQNIETIKKVEILTHAHSPSIFVVSGVGAAAKKVQEITEKLKEILKEYNFESFSSKEKENLFFKKVKPS